MGPEFRQPAASTPDIRKFAKALFVVTDLLLVVAVSGIAIMCRFPGVLSGVPQRGHGFYDHLAVFSLYSILTLLCAQTQRLYRGVQWRAASDEIKAVIKAVGLSTLIVTAFIGVSHRQDISR